MSASTRPRSLTGGAWEDLFLWSAALLGAAGLLLWAPGELAGRIATGQWPEASIVDGPAAIRHTLHSPFDLSRGWLYYLLLAVELTLVGLVGGCLTALRNQNLGLPARLRWEDSSEQRIPRDHRL